MNREEKLFEKYYRFEEVAMLEGVNPRTLSNKISAGEDLPPMSGRGMKRLCLKSEYHKWKAKQAMRSNKAS